MREIVAASIALVGASCAADRPPTVFDRMVEAVNGGDAHEYANVYAENAVISIFGNIQLVGRSSIEQHEVELLKQFPGAQLALYTVWRSGDRAAAHYAVNARNAAGQTMGHEGLLFYRLDANGLISEERRYLDSLTPMAQLGALGAGPARMPPQLAQKTRNVEPGDESTEQANAVTVLATLQSWAAGGQAQLLAHFADDAEVDELMLLEPFTGRDAASRWNAAWSGVRDLRMDIADLFAVGDCVLVEMLVHGTIAGALGPVAAENREFVAHRAVLARLRDGKIVRLACFMNGRELAQAVGQWPPPSAK